MRTVVVTEPGRLATQEVAPPERPGPGELTLELQSVGICGGDVSLLAGRNPLVRYPVVPGHECVATVAEDPSGRLEVGAPVVVYPTSSCGACRACEEGRLNQCAAMTVLGLSNPAGCLSDRFVLPAHQALPLPAAVAEHAGALVEPLAVASHVCDRAALRRGDTALVIGSGTIGSAVGLTARALGARRILFADTLPARGRTLGELGFDDFTTDRDAALTSWVRDHVGAVDVVFDTVTTTATAAVATSVLAGGGRYVTVAAAKPAHRVELDYQAVYEHELAVIATRNYVPADFASAIARLERGEIDPTPLRTAVFGISEAAEAFAELTERPAEHVKVLVTRDELVGSTPLLTPVGAR